MKGDDMCPNPTMRFEDGNFPDYVMTEIVRAGFTAPSAIQSEASPSDTRIRGFQRNERFANFENHIK